MPKHNRSVMGAPRQFIRPGEGALIDVEVANFAAPGGLSGQWMRATFQNAPVPERRYTAHVYSVIEDDDVIRLLFGQKKIAKSVALRSLLIVNMSKLNVAQFLESVDEVNASSFYENVKVSGISAQPPMEIEEEPPQTVELPANLGVCSWSGAEACMDFYRTSPFAIAAVVDTKKLAVDPVVRIDTRASSFLGMLSELKKWRARADTAQMLGAVGGV